jgi:hypothetical protein
MEMFLGWEPTISRKDDIVITMSKFLTTWNKVDPYFLSLSNPVTQPHKVLKVLFSSTPSKSQSKFGGVFKVLPRERMKYWGFDI